MLELSIQKGTPVSIHQQLVTQLSLQIASGLLPAGTKLPSVRALSAKLKIHYNTCLAVYKELTESGLLESKKGSCVQVAFFQQKVSHAHLDHLELQQMAKYFIQIVQERGYSWEEVEMALQVARKQKEQTQKRIAFVDIHPDILPVFQAELKSALKCPVEGLDLNQPIHEQADTCYIVSRYHYKTLKKLLKNEHSILMIDVATGQQEIERIKALPEGSLVTIISHSAIILQMAESVISGLRGQDILLRSLLFSDGMDEIQSATKHAKLVVCDFLCVPILEPFLKKKLSPIQLIPDNELAKIKQQLPG